MYNANKVFAFEINIIYIFLSQKLVLHVILITFYVSLIAEWSILLKALSRVIDRFCQKHHGFGVPRLMLFIVLISAAIFIIGGEGLFNFLAFHPALIMRGEIWRLITWIFLPLTGNIFFVAIALYFYFFVGSTLEREWGTAKFTIYYIFGILLNIIYGFIMWYAFDVYVYLVPNFLNLSMFFAFATLFPDVTVRLFFVIPVKVKWLALFNAAYFIYSIVTDIVTGQIFIALLPVVALLNYILICGEDLLLYIRPLKIKTSPQIVNFKKAAKQAKREQSGKPYRHKCAVCGKTDIDYPDLEFRYCSQCNGYHCFCIDHINNHIHFE